MELKKKGPMKQKQKDNNSQKRVKHTKISFVGGGDRMANKYVLKIGIWILNNVESPLLADPPEKHASFLSLTGRSSPDVGSEP